jgi:hypothetical protein
LTPITAAFTTIRETARPIYPKVQIVAVADLLDGRRPKLPVTQLPYFQAKRRHDRGFEQETLGLIQLSPKLDRLECYGSRRRCRALAEPSLIRQLFTLSPLGSSVTIVTLTTRL